MSAHEPKCPARSALLCTDHSAVGMGVDLEWILASPARVCMYFMADNLVGKCDERLPGRPATVERAVVAAAHAGRRGPCACDFAHATAAWRSSRERCARWRGRTRTPRGAIWSCVRMRAQSHAARRAPPSPWTTACARRSDSPRWPGTLPVPSVVPYATFVTCKCRSECTCGAVRGLGMLYCPWGRRSRHVRALGRPTISAQSPFPQMQPRYPMCKQ